MLTRTFFARAPLAPGRFAPLPVGAVSAQGAMRDRLLALRGGLLSRCASLFPEAGEQSAWFGGALGGGMHAPELLEAMLLTGAQLGDEELRAKRFTSAALWSSTSARTVHSARRAKPSPPAGACCARSAPPIP